MKKFYVLGLALLSVLAFSAVAAGMASAKEWLWNGEAVKTALAATTEGEVELEDMKAFIIVKVLCSGRFIGTVEGTKDETTLVESLTGEDPKMDCVAHEICEGGLAWVTAIHLPWLSTIELMSNGETLDILTGTGGEPGYTVECPAGIFGTFSDTCVAEASTHAQTVLTNEASDVLGTFSGTETITPPGECTSGGSKAGLVVGSGLTFTPEGGTLSVS